MQVQLPPEAIMMLNHQLVAADMTSGLRRDDYIGGYPDDVFEDASLDGKISADSECPRILPGKPVPTVEVPAAPVVTPTTRALVPYASSTPAPPLTLTPRAGVPNPYLPHASPAALFGPPPSPPAAAIVHPSGPNGQAGDVSFKLH